MPHGSYRLPWIEPEDHVTVSVAPPLDEPNGLWSPIVEELEILGSKRADRVVATAHYYWHGYEVSRSSEHCLRLSGCDLRRGLIRLTKTPGSSEGYQRNGRQVPHYQWRIALIANK
jgi:hypothetical protein